MGSKPIGISGSRAATVLGLNDWQSELELWQRLIEEREPGFNAGLGYTLPEDPDNASIRWGTAFEDSIVKLAEEKAGAEIFNRERLFQSVDFTWGLSNIREYKYLSCHIDGCYKIEEKSGYINTLHEGKTTSEFQFKNEWGTPGTDRVPAYVQCQVQHQLLCTGAKKCIVSVLVFPKRPDEWEAMGRKVERSSYVEDANCFVINFEIDGDGYKIVEKNDYPRRWATALDQMGYFHQYEISADPELHKTMLKEYKAWWQRHIIEKQEPDPDRTDDIKRLFPEPVGTIVATEEIERLCGEYKDIGKEISKTGRLGKRRESIKVKILNWIRQQDSVIDDDSREKTIVRDRTGKKLVSWNGKAFR